MQRWIDGENLVQKGL